MLITGGRQANWGRRRTRKGQVLLPSWSVVASNIKQAQALQQKFESEGGVGISLEALDSFGNALHSVTDSMSPPHSGFQEWRIRDLVAHRKAESTITPEQKAAVIMRARELYQKTFGKDRLNQATHEGNQEQDQAKENPDEQ